MRIKRRDEQKQINHILREFVVFFEIQTKIAVEFCVIRKNRTKGSRNGSRGELFYRECRIYSEHSVKRKIARIGDIPEIHQNFPLPSHLALMIHVHRSIQLCAR